MTAKQERAQRRKEELQRRRDLKDYLILSWGRMCGTCGTTKGWLDLVHVLPLSLGGKTDEDNCILECRRCHMKRHHQIKEG